MRRRIGFLGCVVFLAITIAGLAGASQTAPSPTVISSYVTMRDGTRLAVDVWRPAAASREVRLPTILQLTRYWRGYRNNSATVDPEAVSTISYFTSAGYSVAIADMRGTGASFGSRATEFSDAEVEDYGGIIDWIANQSWSNGRVATMGGSYLGNSAELATIPARPALRAVVPRFSDFSEYRHAVRPGGIMNAVIAKAWVSLTDALDRNDVCALQGGGAGAACDPNKRWTMGVKPVDSDADGTLLKSAVSEHAKNANLAGIVDHLIYSDDPFGHEGNRTFTLDSVSPSGRWPLIDKANVPAFHWASWFDGGTAEGVLTRFINYKTKINVIIGPWNHGGGSDADPYRTNQGDAPPKPSVPEQFADIRAFLDPLMLSNPDKKPEPMGTIRYFTVGSNQWRTTDVWPPKGVKMARWYFREHNGFAPDMPKNRTGSQLYRVDFSTTTGNSNRWKTQLGTFVQYGDRRNEDKKLLDYTSAPLAGATEITGSPVVHLDMKSSAADGAMLVYLEDVWPDGKVTYLTEGEIRLLFPGNSLVAAGYKQLGPQHTFTRAEAVSGKPGDIAKYEITLNPISVVLSKGHRLRIAIAGADAGTFERLPKNGDVPVYRIFDNSTHPSYVELPVAP